MNEPAQNSKIIRLASENVKRLQAVEITPTGHIVTIAGKNAQGKTSVLDSIAYALGGAETFDKVPVRQGAKKATIVVELDGLTITRTISASGSTQLVVTDKSGQRYPSPQAILDALVGKLSFDPLAFSRKKPEEQAEILRNIAGLDFSKENAEIDQIYDYRTETNRDVKKLEGQLAGTTPPRAGLPDEEKSTAEILQRQQAAIAANTENEKKRSAKRGIESQISTRKQQVKTAEEDIQELEDQIAAIQKRVEARRKDVESFNNEVMKLEEQLDLTLKEVAALVDQPIDVFQTELSQVESINREVRAAAQRKELQKQIHDKKTKSEGYTKRIAELEEAKTKRIREAKFPIAGLAMNLAGEVIFNDLPLEQASSAQQLRVSVAIGLALNPKLRVLLVRDGSLLDDDSRALLLELATEHDAQVWLEQVGTAGDVSVVIEDGMVKEVAE